MSPKSPRKTNKKVEPKPEVEIPPEEEIEEIEEEEKEIEIKLTEMPPLVREKPIPTMDAFLYQPPFVEKVLMHEHFHCEDLCKFDSEIISARFPPFWSDDTKKLCFAMLEDALQWCSEQQLPVKNLQTLGVLEICLHTFKYFVNGKHVSEQQLKDFFEEQVLRYSVQHPPKSLEIFDIRTAHSLYSLFSALFLPHLSLLRATTAENCIIELEMIDPLLIVKKPSKKKK